jgi:hypothetical protein
MKLIAFAEDILEAELRGVLPRFSRQTEVTHVTGNRTMLVRCRRVEHLREIRRITQSAEIRDSADHARRSPEVGNILAVGRVACVREIAWHVEIVVIERRIHRIKQVLMHDDIRRAENRKIVSVVGVPHMIDGVLCFLPAVGIDDRLSPNRFIVAASSSAISFVVIPRAASALMRPCIASSSLEYFLRYFAFNAPTFVTSSLFAEGIAALRK